MMCRSTCCYKGILGLPHAPLCGSGWPARLWHWLYPLSSRSRTASVAFADGIGSWGSRHPCLRWPKQVKRCAGLLGLGSAARHSRRFTLLYMGALKGERPATPSSGPGNCGDDFLLMHVDGDHVSPSFPTPLFPMLGESRCP